MVIQITMNGFPEVHNFLIKLPKELDKALSKDNTEFMENLKNDAKKLAPMDTGNLKESIHLSPVKQTKTGKIWELIVDADYGIYQEDGFTPHYVTIINSAKLKTPGVYYVSKWTPFMKPAFEKNEAKYLNMLNVSINRGIANAG